jgi:glucokinase
VDVLGALELGGTHITAARVTVGGDQARVAALRRFALAPDGSRDELLAAIAGAARSVAEAAMRRWGVATPGPFDYARGVCTIRGVGKLDALYGTDLRRALADALRLDHPELVRFINDADAFLLGEWWTGAARGHVRAIGVTLGTGLGSAFLRQGEIVESDPDVPAEGRLDLVPFHGAPVEDLISRRGLLAAYGRPGLDVDEMAQRARAGEPKARQVFAGFGAALGEFLTPWIDRFDPTCLVLGGSIARSWDLFAGPFRAACAPAAILARCGVAERLEEAPLLGATLHAQRYA